MAYLYHLVAPTRAVTSFAKALTKLLNHQELVWFDISLATTESIVRRAEKIAILLSDLALIKEELKPFLIRKKNPKMS